RSVLPSKISWINYLISIMQKSNKGGGMDSGISVTSCMPMIRIDIPGDTTWGDLRGIIPSCPPTFGFGIIFCVQGATMHLGLPKRCAGIREKWMYITKAASLRWAVALTYCTGAVAPSNCGSVQPQTAGYIIISPAMSGQATCLRSEERRVRKD